MDFGFEHFFSQGKAIQSISEEIQKDSLVHALLITGEPGVGKKTLACLIASALLCTGSGEKPCGGCASCRMMAAGEHPDLIMIRRGVPLSSETRKDRTTIPVDDIREMIRLSATHPFSGDRRVVMICEADRMTVSAQNALLKTLEEPPEGTWFLLICERQDQLLPTIISRCRPIRLAPWKEEHIERILLENEVETARAAQTARVSHGSIGTALKIARDEEYWTFRDEVLRSFFRCESRSHILEILSGWKDRKNDAETLFRILEDSVDQLLHDRLTGEKTLRSFPETAFPESWICFAEKCDLSAFTVLLDGISTARKQVQASVHFQTVLEQLLFLLMEERDRW